MREIRFFVDENGKKPIEEFLDSLSSKHAQKVVWVLQLLEEQEFVSTKFFKQLVNTDGLWEVRAQQGNNNFRLLGFVHKGALIVLTNGFSKKTQKHQNKKLRWHKNGD